MTAIKIETLTVRLDPHVKKSLRTAATQDRRSLANMIEVMIRDDCERRGIRVPEATDFPPTPGNR